MTNLIRGSIPQKRDRSVRRIIRDIDGTPLCINDLPNPGCNWTARRKARVLIAIDGGIVAKDDALARYGISEEELASWRGALDAEGIDGLKATRGRP